MKGLSLSCYGQINRFFAEFIYDVAFVVWYFWPVVFGLLFTDNVC